MDFAKGAVAAAENIRCQFQHNSRTIFTNDTFQLLIALQVLYAHMNLLSLNSIITTHMN